MSVLRYVKSSSTEAVADYISGVITTQLESGKRVLWLISGGSVIDIAVAVSQRLHDTSLEKLTVTLTDERYGVVGHSDSNWQQLERAGFWLQDAILQPVLVGKDMSTTIKNYNSFLVEDFAVNDYCFGLFGMGPDGHAAGILPHSDAATDAEFVHGYKAPDYERITMTPVAIAQLDEVVLYAMGQAKWPMIDQLDTVVPLRDQPAQALKAVPKLTIYNDHKGDEL